MTTLTYKGTLHVTSCWCGIPCAIPTELYKIARNNRTQVVYCPLGHTFIYGGDTELTKTRKELERAEAARVRVKQELEAERRSHSATKGKLTKTRRRIANGVCPFCNRHFDNVEAHMHSKHPSQTSQTSNQGDKL